MTVYEALQKSIDTLNSICVPVPMLQQIGSPISGAISLIQASMDALARNEAAKEDPQENMEESEPLSQDESAEG